MTNVVPTRGELFGTQVDVIALDNFVLQMGQKCLYFPVRRCTCILDIRTGQPDPSCDLCGGLGDKPIQFPNLEEFEYQTTQVKDGALGERLGATIGLEILTPARIRIEGPFQITAEATTSLGDGEFEGLAGGSLAQKPRPYSVKIQSDSGLKAWDDGAGAICGGATGTVDYETKAINYTFRDGSDSASSTIDYIYTHTFIYLTDFDLETRPQSLDGPVWIVWIGDEPITNEKYRIISTMKRHITAVTTDVTFKMKQTWEPGLFEDGDVRLTASATEIDFRTEPWTRIEVPIWQLKDHDIIVIWDSHRPQTEPIVVPGNNILDLKWNFVSKIEKVYILDDDEDIPITPVSFESILGTVTLPSGHAGRIVTVEYTHRPIYNVYWQHPQVRFHEGGRRIPKFIVLRPMDASIRGAKVVTSLT